MSSPTSDRSKLVVGTAPDSWGVWFAKDDHQVGWQQYLNEVALAGYVWTELGPQGFVPQDPAQLRDELASRGLRVSGGTVFAGLHKGPDALTEAIAAFGREARLLSEVGAKYLVHLPEQYTDMHTGAATGSGDLDTEQWKNLVTGTNELGRVIFEEHGVQLVFHPHADTHVDTQDRILQFLADTDPRYVNLCLDTGHVAYCDGDNIEIIRQAPERITYVHLKFVDPTVRQRVRAENLSLAEAVPLGVMVEPPYGEPAVPPLLDALSSLDREVFTILEQDLYPVAPSIPLGIQARAAGYLTGCGIGPIRRWPNQQ
jgi:inosose dehydratase